MMNHFNDNRTKQVQEEEDEEEEYQDDYDDNSLISSSTSTTTTTTTMTTATAVSNSIDLKRNFKKFSFESSNIISSIDPTFDKGTKSSSLLINTILII
jgi:hypothetical protein